MRIGIDRARVEAAFRAVELCIFGNELWRVGGDVFFGVKIVGGRKGGVAVLCGVPAAIVQLRFHLVACFGGLRGGAVVAAQGVLLHIDFIAVGHNAGHVVHGAGGNRLDAGVAGGGVQRHAAPAANAQDADLLAVHEILQAEKIDGGGKVFGIDVGRCHIAWLAARFAKVGRVKRQGYKAAFGHCLRVQPAGLLLHRAKCAGHGNRRQLLAGADVFWHIQVACQCDAIAVFEGDFAVFHFVGFWEYLVPLLGE